MPLWPSRMPKKRRKRVYSPAQDGASGLHGRISPVEPSRTPGLGAVVAPPMKDEWRLKGKWVKDGRMMIGSCGKWGSIQFFLYFYLRQSRELTICIFTCDNRRSKSVMYDNTIHATGCEMECFSTYRYPCLQGSTMLLVIVRQ